MQRCGFSCMTDAQREFQSMMSRLLHTCNNKKEEILNMHLMSKGIFCITAMHILINPSFVYQENAKKTVKSSCHFKSESMCCCRSVIAFGLFSVQRCESLICVLRGFVQPLCCERCNRNIPTSVIPAVSVWSGALDAQNVPQKLLFVVSLIGLEGFQNQIDPHWISRRDKKSFDWSWSRRSMCAVSVSLL